MALSPEQRKVLAHILRVARQKGASPKEVKAAIETGLVEANLSNPSGGDADSAGWRQERASLYKDPTNLDASIGRFFDETHAVKGKYSRAGDLAAAVQRPAAQYRGRYQGRSGEAQALLGGSSAYQSPAGRTTTRTVGAVDNSQARKDLAAQFLLGSPNAQGQHNSTDVLGLALAAQGLKDDPGHQVTTTTAASDSPAGGGGFGKSHSQLLELIHNTGNGPGYAVKNGQKVNGPQFYSAVWAGHQNHVHVAAGPKTIVQLGKLAQSMGLSVGENPHFGTVHRVHAPDSYHYKNEAIDVSGDPRKMNAFAQKVQQLYGIH